MYPNLFEGRAWSNLGSLFELPMRSEIEHTESADNGSGLEEKYVQTRIANCKASKCFVDHTIPVPWGHIAVRGWNDPNSIPVLVLHGILDNCGSFNRLIPLLPTSHYYLCVDLPGHGLSSHFPPGIPLDFLDCMDAVRRVVRHLGWTKFVWMGHSFGGQLGVMFASVYPELVEKLIMIDAISSIDVPTREIGSYLRVYHELLSKLDTHNIPPSYSYHEALDRLMNKRMDKISLVAVKELLERSVAETSGRFSYVADQRLKLLVYPLFDMNQLLAVFDNVRCPQLIIISKYGRRALSCEIFRKCFEKFKSRSNFSYVNMDGNHDVHSDSPAKFVVGRGQDDERGADQRLFSVQFIEATGEVVLVRELAFHLTERSHASLVEADKQNAAKLNALVQPKALVEDWTNERSDLRRSQQSGQAPSDSSSHNRTTPREGRHIEQTANISPRARKSGNGPPPDPVYNFLADHDRDSVREDRPPRRGPRDGGYGSRGRDRRKEQRNQHDLSSPEYEAWRAERNRIDQDRINRQKTAEGHWRREWDNEKMAQGGNEDQSPRKLVRGAPPRGSYSDQSPWSNHDSRQIDHGASGDTVHQQSVDRSKMTRREVARSDKPAYNNTGIEQRTSPNRGRSLKMNAFKEPESQSQTSGNIHAPTNKSIVTGSQRATPRGRGKPLARTTPREIRKTDTSPDSHFVNKVSTSEDLIKSSSLVNESQFLTYTSDERFTCAEQRKFVGDDSSQVSSLGSITGTPGDRNVVSVGQTFKISFSNEAVVPSPEVKRVRVKVPQIVGTGRVGPKQNVRPSYSSQSEDEAVQQTSSLNLKRSLPNIQDSSPRIVQTVTLNLASLKPPLPPSPRDDPKPRRQRPRALAKARLSRKYSSKRGGRCSEKENGDEAITESDTSREVDSEGGGDDSWEDVSVTTTSGGESASEMLEERPALGEVDTVSQARLNHQVNEQEHLESQTSSIDKNVTVEEITRDKLHGIIDYEGNITINTVSPKEQKEEEFFDTIEEPDGKTIISADTKVNEDCNSSYQNNDNLNIALKKTDVHPVTDETGHEITESNKVTSECAHLISNNKEEISDGDEHTSTPNADGPQNIALSNIKEPGEDASSCKDP
uniref:AB hydrolase-1 domain-containing protein n=1 Tax=Timema monikensis TaxID=170555 RepID=A0A7R9EBU8_9NEOP|nr:unnamed protein product [Timema monikensis]